MNRTLEELAAAIFKSWFVDFDPVVARAEGRQPFGMDAETAALFPAAFEESEAGAVPAGWRVGPIGELVEVVGGTTPSTGNATYWEAWYRCWATPKDLPDCRSVLLDTERRITQGGLQQIRRGLLPAGTVLIHPERRRLPGDRRDSSGDQSGVHCVDLRPAAVRQLLRASHWLRAEHGEHS